MTPEFEKLIDLNSFIDYLESTSENEWQMDTVRSEGNNKNCVMGHLVNWYYEKDFDGIISPIWDAFEEMWATTYMIYLVNDGKSPDWMSFKYDQSTPKQRVIAYLKNLRDKKEKTSQELWKESYAQKEKR